MTIQSFDKINLKTLRVELTAALSEVAKRNGIKLDIGSIRFSGEAFSCKLQGAIPMKLSGTNSTSTDSSMTVKQLHEASALKTYASVYGLDVARVGTYKLIGFNSRRHAYPFSMIRVKDGKAFKCSTEQAKMYFGKVSKVS